MPSQPVRAFAAELARRVTSAASGTEPLTVAVVGAAGSGRTGVLAAATAAAERSGRPTRTLDDVDRVDDAALAAIEAAPGADIVLVSWTEPRPPRDVLGRWAQRAGRRNLLVQLGPLGEGELANGVAALTDGTPDRTLIEWLALATANQPWLVHATIDALVSAGRVARGRFSGQPPSFDDEALAPVLDRIRAELHGIPSANRKALAALVADSDAATLAELAVAVPDDWTALCAAGLVTVDAVAPLVTLAASTLLSPAERAAGHQAVARLMARRGGSFVDRAEHAWAGRAHSEDASHGYREAGFELLASAPSAAAVWFDRASASAPSTAPLALAGKGAQAEALVLAGDLPAAIELADFVLGRDEHEPHAAAAVALASAKRGRWVDVAHWSARVRGHHRVSDEWWWWQQQAALLLSGRLADVDRNLADVDRHAAVTPIVGQLRDAVLVTRASLQHDRETLLAARRDSRSSVGAQALSLPPAVAAVVPSELLAATALALGEPEGARQAFANAAHVAMDPRRRAQARWAVLRCGDLVRPDAARAASATSATATSVSVGGSGAGAGTAGVTGPAAAAASSSTEASGGGATPDGDDARDPVSLAVAAALARRSGDVGATGAVARKLPRLLSTLQIDLLNLDASTELLVVARRFAPASVAEEFEAAIDAFLVGIGRAPAWSARWHWAQLEAAIGAGQTGGVAPAARALEAIAAVLPGVSVLADAATVWVDVLTGTPDPTKLDGTVRNLQTAGYVWEAAQLAGQAAIRVDDATLAKSLLGQARSLRGGVPAASASGASNGGAGGGREEGGSSVTPAGLSEREVEVARLVLNGLTHKAIGATLYISPKTVEHHVAHIRQKLGATNRAEFLAALRVDLAALAEP